MAEPAIHTTPPVGGHPLSLTGCRWVMREADDRKTLAMIQRHNLPEVLARVLVGRGIGIDDIDAFMNPSLKSALPDPSHLLDMDAAAERVASAVMSGERIAIFGDYDVDGATSSALLARYLRALGNDPLIYIPDRMTEGYGPNAKALLSLKQQRAALVVTVDCGTLAFEPLDAAHEAGLDVIVVDHHVGEARKPKACAIVNPNRLDETSPHGNLAAVGVAFLLIAAVNRHLRACGWFEKPSPLEGEDRMGGASTHSTSNTTQSPLPLTDSAGNSVAVSERLVPIKGRGNREEPDLKQWLDLVALGTVCDVVPLTGVNRALVKQGLKVMAARGNKGIATVLDLAGIHEKPGVYHAGFVIGPRINAGGRVGRSDLGVRLLTTDDPAEALMLAKELDQHNAERKAIEQMVLEAAMEQAQKADISRPLLLVAGQGWHPGVIGIVAGRLKEKFHAPAAVIALEGGIGKASARSVPGVDFGAAVIAAREAGLLIAGGGHAMAAGFTVEQGKIPALAEFFEARFAKSAASLSRRKQLLLDGNVSIGGATAELVDLLEGLGPFGQGHPAVRVAVRNVMNLKPEPVGESHVRTLLIDGLSKIRLSAIAFRAQGGKLGEALMQTRGRAVDVAGQLRLNEWNGRKSVNLMIEDIAACN